MADRWRVTVLCRVDGTTHERVFIAHKISAQVFDDPAIPRRAAIRCYDKRGRVTESFQCNVESIHRQRIRGKS